GQETDGGQSQRPTDDKESGNGLVVPASIAGEQYVDPCPQDYTEVSSCESEGSVCTYGNAGRLECRVRLTCSGGSWMAASACTPDYPSTECSADASVGGACQMEGERCAGVNGRECICVMNAWNCDAPVVNQPGCPPLVPNTGTACDADGTLCQYSRCNVAGT